MNHPLDTLPTNARKPLFWTFLVATVVLFAIFRALNAPLVTPAAPGGIVTFELAGSASGSQAILDSWDARARTFAAFGLGLDYLFMPTYALALMLGMLLAAGRHAGWLKTLGALAGWGALAAALFDAVENIALWKVLLGDISTSWPVVAEFCATLKFALLTFGLVTVLISLVWRRTSGETEER
jgi:hypothetical protein